MEKAREFVALGYTGIFDYVRNALALSEAQAMYFQKVVRASVQVPTLEKAVTSGVISLSQARRIVPVVTEKNAETWIEAAKDLTQRELEHAVASVNPNATKIERLKPVAKETSKLELTLSDEVVEMLRREQDLECQRQKRPVSLEETLKAVLARDLERTDPVKKAERAKPKAPKRFPQEGKRALPAAVKHAVVRRDGNRCQHPGCDSTRWVEISRSYTSRSPIDPACDQQYG
jgi:hypothetical protein